MALSVRRLGYALGAEITGLDLRATPDAPTVARLRELWLEHVVLCFPRQPLSPVELSRFFARFGELDDNRATPHLRHPDDPAVIVVANAPVTVGTVAYRGQISDHWHTDLSYTARPSTATVLAATALPSAGGDTMFANMYRAYDALSEGMQRLLDPLGAVHDITLNATFRKGTERSDLQEKRRRENPPVVHPVVRVHPETGRKALYLGSRIRSFEGMTEEATQPLLAFLNGHAVRYEFCYRHRWSLHDVVMWDNRCALHYAVPDYDRGEFRSMLRCSLAGEPASQPSGPAARSSAAQATGPNVTFQRA